MRSAGVSTRRVVVPILLAACAMLGLTVANQELVLPNIDMFLVENRGNFTGEKQVEIRGVYDSRHIFRDVPSALHEGEPKCVFRCDFIRQQRPFGFDRPWAVTLC